MIENGNYEFNDRPHYVLNENCGGDDAAECITKNFIFSHMYNSDLHTDAKFQQDIQTAAFNLIDDKHLELYKLRIKNSFFQLYNSSNNCNIVDDAMPKNVCCHHYIVEMQQIVTCIKELEKFFEMRNNRNNVLVFYPYLKQLNGSAQVLKKTFVCCLVLIENMQTYINEVVSHCLLCIQKLKLLQQTVEVMNLFAEKTILYECDVCKEVSTDKRFLKPKECCEFSICNACVVKLWKMATTHAKCPACRMSFKC